MPPLTFEELNALPTVVDLVTAARALGIGRTKAYQLAQTGQSHAASSTSAGATTSPPPNS
jgi:hypothetical protein